MSTTINIESVAQWSTRQLESDAITLFVPESPEELRRIPAPPRPSKNSPSENLDAIDLSGDSLDELVDKFPAPQDWD